MGYTHVRLPLDVYFFFPFQQEFHRFHVLFFDRVQQRVFHLDPGSEQHLDQVHVLVLDGRYQRRPVQRIRAVDVEHVRLALVFFQQPESSIDTLKRFIFLFLNVLVW